MVIKCDFQFEGLKRKKNGKKLGDYDPDVLNDIQKRAFRLHQIFNANAAKHADFVSQKAAETAKYRAMIDNIYMQDVGELIDLGKHNIDKLEAFLANRFNLKAKGLGLSPDLDYTTAGKLREGLSSAGQVARGLVEEQIKLIGLKKIKEADNVIKEILTSKGITDSTTLGELRIDAIEVGQIPRMRVTYKLGEAADRINLQRYQDFITRLKKLGVTDDEIEEIIDAATSISATMDEARAMGNAFGLDIGNVEGIGYVSRVYTPDAKRFIDRIAKSELSRQQLDPQKIGVFNTNVTKSRTTFNYIPEDDAVVAYQLGLEIEELNDLLAEGNFTKWMHENVSDDLLENMVDVGSISKLPMTTKETYEYIVTKFGDQLPFKGMDEIFITDPTRIGEYYTDFLQDAVRESAMARTVVREGLENGWAVPDTVYKANPSNFSNFKRLDADSIRQYFPEYAGHQAVWVDPYVDDTWRSLLGMASQPGTMGTLAQNISYFGSFFNSALLLNPGYPLRVLYDSFRNFFAAGGNALRYVEGWSDLLKVTRKSDGINLLDDTRKVYTSLDGKGLISERQLYQEWIRHRGADFVPLTGGRKVASNVDGMWKITDANPFNLPKAVNYLMHYIKAFGAVEGAAAAFDMFKGAQSDIFEKFAITAAFFEASSKWGLIKSLADTSAGNRVGQFASNLGVAPPELNNLRDLFRHVDDYFPQWSDTGDLVNFFNSAIRPFSVFAMYNPPAQIRQALRRPHEFVNYWRIKNFLNQSQLQDEDLNDATVPDWVKRGAPFFLSKDKETGEWMTMLTGNWDARADAFSYIDESGERLQESFGLYVGSTENQRDLIENGRPGLLGYFQELFKEGQPLIRNLLSIATNTDIRSGRPIDRDDTQGRTTAFNLPYEVEYILTAYPPIQKLVDVNPGDIFGRPEFRDPKTNEVIIQAKPGIFGSRRVDYDISKYRGEKRDMVTAALRNLGFNVKIIDVGRSMQYSFTESKSLYQKTKSDLGRMRKDLTLEYLKDPNALESPEFQRRLNLFNDRVSQMAQLHKDTLVIGAMMQERGIKPTESYDKIEQDMLRVVPGRIGDDIIKKAIDDLDMYLTVEELQNNGSTQSK